MTKKKINIGIILSLIIFGVIVSSLSLLINNGIDKSEEKTVGIITYRGFPISFSSNAPGYSWAQYDLTAYILNTALWSIIFIGAWIILRHKIKHKKSQQYRIR